MKFMRLSMAASIIASMLSFNTVAAGPALNQSNEGRSVEPNNHAAIERWEREHKDAQALLMYAVKLVVDMSSMVAVNNNGGGPALMAFTRDVNDTAERLEKLGPTVGSPFSACPEMGAYMATVWKKLIAQRSSEAEMEQIVGSYQNSFLICQRQIMTPPT